MGQEKEGLKFKRGREEAVLVETLTTTFCRSLENIFPISRRRRRKGEYCYMERDDFAQELIRTEAEKATGRRQMTYNLDFPEETVHILRGGSSCNIAVTH